MNSNTPSLTGKTGTEASLALLSKGAAFGPEVEVRPRTVRIPVYGGPHLLFYAAVVMVPLPSANPEPQYLIDLVLEEPIRYQ